MEIKQLHLKGHITVVNKQQINHLEIKNYRVI